MRKTLSTLHDMARKGEKIAALTCYDASFAKLLEAAGVDILLVGDSLGMVLQGRESTLPVTLEQMVYHVECVARGSSQAFIVADMTFGSYQDSPQQAFRNASQLLRAGAHDKQHKRKRINQYGTFTYAADSFDVVLKPKINGRYVSFYRSAVIITKFHLAMFPSEWNSRRLRGSPICEARLVCIHSFCE